MLIRNYFIYIISEFLCNKNYICSPMFDRNKCFFYNKKAKQTQVYLEIRSAVMHVCTYKSYNFPANLSTIGISAGAHSNMGKSSSANHLASTCSLRIKSGLSK